MFRPKSTFEQWRIFQAVVDCGGYAQAAEALNKSQSSLNHAAAGSCSRVWACPLLEGARLQGGVDPGGRDLSPSVCQLSQQGGRAGAGQQPGAAVGSADQPSCLGARCASDRSSYRALAGFYPRSRVAGSTCTSAHSLPLQTPCNREI